MTQRAIKIFHEKRIELLLHEREIALKDLHEELEAWWNWETQIVQSNMDDPDYPEFSVGHLRHFIIEVLPEYFKVLFKSPSEEDDDDPELAAILAIVQFLLRQLLIYNARVPNEPFTEPLSSPTPPAVETPAGIDIPPILTPSSSSTGTAFVPFWQQLPIEVVFHHLTVILQPKPIFYGTIDQWMWGHDQIDPTEDYPPRISRRRAQILRTIFNPMTLDDTDLINLLASLLQQEVGSKRCAHVGISVLHFLESVLPSQKPEIAGPLAATFAQLVLSTILSVSDDEIKHLSKDALFEASHRVGSLLQNCHTPDLAVLYGTIEDFNLKKAIKLLKCPFLDKRLTGLHEIRRMLELALNSKPEWDTDARPLLQVPSLAAALHAENLVEILFGDNMHVQLLQRVPEVLKMMAQHHLTAAHLDMIWEASRGKHESVVAQIYVIVSSMPSYLSRDTTEYMYEKIERAAKEACDEALVGLIRTFSKAAAQHNEKHWIGIGLLWEVFNNPEMQAPVPVRIAAFMCLQELLRNPLYYPLRQEYLKKCIQNLQAQSNVAYSLRLMTTIFHTNPLRPLDLLTMADCTDQALVPLLMADCTSFLEAKQGLDELSASLTRSENWLERLQFFLYVLVHSSLTLSFEHISALWQRCAKPAPLATVPTEESKWETDKGNEFFSWLVEALNKVNGANVAVIDTPTLDRILDELVSGLVFRNLSGAGFSFVERLFKKLNERKGFLSFSELTMIVTHSNLVGMDTIWEIAFGANESSVSQRAISLINTIYHSFGSGISLNEKYEECVGKCMARLQRCSSVLLAGPKRTASNPRPVDGEVAYAELQIERCFIMLNLFLDTFEGTVDPSHLSTVNPFTAAHRTHIEVDERGEPTDDVEVGPAAEVAVKVTIIQSGQSTTIALKPCISVGDVKDQVAAYLRISQEQIKNVICGGRMLDATKTLKAENVVNGAVLHVPVKTKPLPANREEPTAPIHPSHILARPEYFNHLFDMLGTDLLGCGDRQGLADTCWSLLMKLPTNTDLLARLQGLSSELDWGQLLDSEHPYRLHYSLQVIASNLRDLNTQTTAEDAKTASRLEQEWAKKFVDLGGLRHLISILLSAGFESQSLECLSLLIQLLLEFVRASGADTSENGDETKKRRRSESGAMNVDPPVSIMVGHNKSRKIADDHEETVQQDSDTESDSNVPRKKSKVETQVTEQKEKPELSDSRARMRTDVATTFSLPVLNKLFQFVQAASAMDEDAEEAAKAKKASTDVVSAVVSSTLELLSTILCSPQLGELCKAFFNQVVVLERWVEDVLLRASRAKIRIVASDRLYKICKYWYPKDQYLHSTVFEFLVQFLFREFNRFCKDWVFTSSNFMRILMRLFDDLSGSLTHSHPDKGADKTLTILSEVLGLLLRYPVTESYSNGMADQTLMGLMNFASALVKAGTHHKGDSPPCCDVVGRLVHQKRIISHIHKEFLFDVPIVKHPADLGNFLDPIRCKSSVTRQNAFRLLTSLAQTSTANRIELLKLSMDNHTFNQNRGFNYAPNTMKQVEPKYVGLQNLGATCYLNSLMQQLYMVPEFREGIFSVPEPNNEDKSEDMLYQLQYLFGFLQESQKRYHDPWAFCDAYRDGDNQPLQKGVQMDVNEFFNVLFDKLEAALKSHPAEKLLDKIFGGTISNQLICKECPHRSERIENFYILSVEIKNKRSIKESLELYVEGEMLEGNNKYMCQICKKKVDTLKRACIKELPANLIIHLKRFEFDLENMRKIKINDYCEFPMILDMAPYTAEYLESKMKVGEEAPAPSPTTKISRPYKLTGVLVHTGTCNSGHYYSFIKERQVHHAGAAPQWLQFNDTKVEPMAVSDLKEHCFGGGEMSAHKQQSYLQKPYSAYMLFYERMEASDNLWEESKSSAPPPGLINPVQAAEKVPPSIFDQCWEDNTNFASDKLIFDDDYIRFCTDLCFMGHPALVSPEIALPCAQLATSLTIHTIMRKAKAEFPRCEADVMELLQNHPAAAVWFLEELNSHSDWIVDLLVKCPSLKTRQGCGKIINAAMTAVGNAEGTCSDEDEKDEMASLPSRTLRTLIELAEQAFKTWRQSGPYWELFANLTIAVPALIPLMCDEELIVIAIQFAMGKDCASPHPKFNKSTDKLREKSKKIMGHILDVVTSMVEQKSEAQEELGEEERQLLLIDTSFFKAVLADAGSPKLLIKCLVVLSEHDKDFTKAIDDVFQKAFTAAAAETLRTVLDAYFGFLEVILENRALKSLDHFLTYIKANCDKYVDDTRICMQALAEASVKPGPTRGFIADKISYLLTWMHTTTIRPTAKDDIQFMLNSLIGSDDEDDEVHRKLREGTCEFLEQAIKAKPCKYLGHSLFPAMQLLLQILKRLPTQRPLMMTGAIQMLMAFFRDLAELMNESNKLHVVNLILESIQHDSELIQSFAADNCSRLLLNEVVFCDVPQTVKFNEMYLPQFFHLTHLVSERNMAFASDLASSKLFGWTIARVGLNMPRAFPTCSEVLAKEVQYLSEIVPEKRGSMLQHIFFEPMQWSDVRVIHITKMLVLTPTDALTFLQTQGFAFMFSWLAQPSSDFASWPVQHVLLSLWMTCLKVAPAALQKVNPVCQDHGVTALSRCPEHDLPESWEDVVTGVDGETVRTVDCFLHIRAWVVQVLPDMLAPMIRHTLHSVQSHPTDCMLKQLENYISLSNSPRPAIWCGILGFKILLGLIGERELDDCDIPPVFYELGVLISRVPSQTALDGDLGSELRLLIRPVVTKYLALLRFPFVGGLFRLAAAADLPDLDEVFALLEQALSTQDLSLSSDVRSLTQLAVTLATEQSRHLSKLAGLLPSFRATVGVEVELEALKALLRTSEPSTTDPPADISEPTEAEPSAVPATPPAPPAPPSPAAPPAPAAPPSPAAPPAPATENEDI